VLQIIVNTIPPILPDETLHSRAHHDPLGVLEVLKTHTPLCTQPDRKLVNSLMRNPQFLRNIAPAHRSLQDFEQAPCAGAIIELQDYDRLQHTTHLPGELVADAYVDWMLGRADSCGLCSSRIVILFSQVSSPAGSSRR
jgi:hypothetical protein